MLSDQTLGNLRADDPVSAQLIGDSFNHWDDVEMFFKGRSVRSGGHGFCGIGRKKLLNFLQERCIALGVELVFKADVQDDQAAARQYNADLLIACDGLNSRVRNRYADTYKPEVEMRECRFVWLGTKKTFDAFTFAFEQTEHGWFAAHAYKFDANTSTFIVETPQAVCEAHGLDKMSQEDGIAFCERLFAKYLDDRPLMNNATHIRGSLIWIRFPRVVCDHWVHTETIAGKPVPIVLMGDAAHHAHFLIGSSTKLALEDAIELARCFAKITDMTEALQAYEAVRSVEVLKIQNAARNSTEWFEKVDRYSGLDAEQFFYSMMRRSQRISHENLRVRDADWLAGCEQWLAKSGSGKSTPAPMLLPLKVRDVQLKNRVVVSPMATYSAIDGLVRDFHLVHLCARALGGVAVVFVEITSPCPEGRITPGRPGLYNETQMQAFKRIVDFAHASGNGAKMGLQLGHSGPKGSTQVGWEQEDEPLVNGNWPLIAASAVAFSPTNQTLSAMTHLAMDRVTAEFVQSTRFTIAAGYDWMELHYAHGYLLSSLITPLNNLRTDGYGGSLEKRCRYSLEVFRAMRAVWPAQLPMSVRISAHDWAPSGNTDDDVVAIARIFKAARCDVIDVSSRQTTRAAKPVYGCMYQTPFADRIRNEVGIQTMAVGAISEGHQINSIIAAGRADLCVSLGPTWPTQRGRCMKTPRCKAATLPGPNRMKAGGISYIVK